MPTSNNPVPRLTYSPVSGEFTVHVTNTKNVSYLLEYDWDKDDLSGSDALTNTQNADDQNVFEDVQLAGTESSGDKFVHQVTNGKLVIAAKTLDDQTYSYQQVFKVTSSGAVKTISEESSIKAETGVLGENTETAEITATPAAKPATTPVRNTTTQPISNSLIDEAAPTSASNTTMMIAAGFVAVLVLGAGLIFKKKRRANK
jgi:LPXTG-motif cell wall-anchored protein